MHRGCRESEEERVSANWDESSSQVSRRIGPLKPLNAGGGRNTAPCVRVFVWPHASFPVETHLEDRSERVVRCASGWGNNVPSDPDSMK